MFLTLAIFLGTILAPLFAIAAVVAFLFLYRLRDRIGPIRLRREKRWGRRSLSTRGEHRYSLDGPHSPHAYSSVSWANHLARLKRTGKIEEMDKDIRINIVSRLTKLGQQLARSVDVECRLGSVELSGMVDNEAERAEVERIAIATPGVQNVANLIETKPGIRTARAM